MTPTFLYIYGDMLSHYDTFDEDGAQSYSLHLFLASCLFDMELNAFDEAIRLIERYSTQG